MSEIPKFDPGYNVFSLLPWVVLGYNPIFEYGK